MDLRNSSCDVMAIQRYLTDRILGQDEAPLSAEADAATGAPDAPGGLFEFLTGDSRQIDAEEANRKFHEDVQILQGSETCEMAFKASRDTILFTTKRMVMIDVQGIGSKKVEYKSIPWICVQAFGLQSAAAFLDKDTELMIWTDIYYTYETEKETVMVKRGEEEVEEEKTIYIPIAGPVSYISIDFQKDKVDLAAVGRYMASRCPYSALRRRCRPRRPHPKCSTTAATLACSSSSSRGLATISARSIRKSSMRSCAATPPCCFRMRRCRWASCVAVMRWSSPRTGR